MKGLVSSGALIMELPGGKSLFFGDANSEAVRVQIKDQATIRKLCLNPDLALGEAYMEGHLTIEGDNLGGFLELLLRNMSEVGEPVARRVVAVVRNTARRIGQYNPISKATRNVRHHYDLSDELYELFLDDDRQYSCAYFKSPDDTLETAQQQKKDHIARKLRLKEGDSVLDIGSGWGGMGLTLAGDYGCKVFGVTLSSGQHRISNLRARDAKLADRSTFALMDYRSVNGKFDRIVSVGMFEHVGAPHYREYFRAVHNLLKDDGIALIHTIGRSSPPGTTSPWLAKYIFPGGYVPALSEVMTAIERENLMVNDIEVLWLHYAETLRHWNERFMNNIDRIREMYDDRFCRMWRYYLYACENTFRHGQTCVYQIQMSKKKGAVPLTRDYIYS